ncbi:hypothetical protein LCGC14_2773820 [marine sediment metagenome]|uniref:Uncharacterized protein n=1 Tax=marine sediment metagenome TaxID=412755 RepID=A0A0F8YVB4_9ZZZZ
MFKLIGILLLLLSTSYSQVIYGWDDDDYHVPGILFSLDIDATTVDADSIVIRQSIDDEGLFIYGFDDKSTSLLKLYIDAAGTAYINATNSGLVLKSANDDVFLIPGANDDVHIHLGDAAGAQQWQVEDSGSNVKATIDSDGNAYFAGDVGIGTSSPNFQLDVESASGITTARIYSPTADKNANLYIDSGDRDALLELWSDGSKMWRIRNDANGTGNDQYVITDAGDAAAFSIKQDGSVGIGTVSPGSMLDINGSLDFNSLAAGGETAIEAVVDLSQLQGSVTDGQVPANITIVSSAEIRSNIRFDVSGSNGIGAPTTYNFGGGGSGDIASMTFRGGILTAVTTVP